MSAPVSPLKLPGDRFLSLDRPLVMGILNATPDSFSDGGRYEQVEHAFLHAQSMAAAGASIIDVGGESTRPGAIPVTEQEEIDRVCPVIEKIAAELDVLISVDTSTPGVMKAAVAAGAHIINDVRALARPGALEAALSLNVPVCLMHMQGSPGSMQSAPSYDDVVSEVFDYLLGRVDVLTASGFLRSNIMIDPGFGFGKTLEHNRLLFQHLPRFLDLGLPLLVGVSRKSMIGAILGKNVDDRVVGSVVAAGLAAQKGAHILRVHDVGPTVDALKIVEALM